MDAWEKLGFVFVTIVAVIALTALTSAIFSYGQIDYCKIIWNKDSTKSYQLIGHRPWNNNEVIASNLETFEDAVGKANQISCEIR